MCLIIKQAVIPERIFRLAAQVHSHGIGMMYKEYKSLITYKTMNEDEAWEYYAQIRSEGITNISLFFRNASVGDATIGNLGPYVIAEDVAFMHNGTLPLNNVPQGMSDSAYLAQTLAKHPESYKTLSDMARIPELTNSSRFLIQTHTSIIKRGIWQTDNRIAISSRFPMNGLLAIYGTLKRGNPASKLLAKSEYVGNAILRGYQLYSNGRYPIAVPTRYDDNNEPSISVELYKIDADTLEAIDSYESAPELFTRIVAITPLGYAFIYIQKSAPVEAIKITKW